MMRKKVIYAFCYRRNARKIHHGEGIAGIRIRILDHFASIEGCQKTVCIHCTVAQMISLDGNG